MNIKIEFRENKNKKIELKFIRVDDNGNEWMANYIESQALTGTTGESSQNGIFTNTDSIQTFYYGENSKPFRFKLFHESDIVEIENELRDRVQKVSAWVAEVKATNKKNEKTKIIKF